LNDSINENGLRTKSQVNRMSKTNERNEIRGAVARPASATKPAHARAWELARQQGVKPIKSIKELQGDFWPEEESVDEFLELVRSIRHQDRISNRNE
jgi:hypothetical protein